MKIAFGKLGGTALWRVSLALIFVVITSNAFCKRTFTDQINVQALGITKDNLKVKGHLIGSKSGIEYFIQTEGYYTSGASADKQLSFYMGPCEAQWSENLRIATINNPRGFLAKQIYVSVYLASNVTNSNPKTYSMRVYGQDTPYTSEDDIIVGVDNSPYRTSNSFAYSPSKYKNDFELENQSKYVCFYPAGERRLYYVWIKWEDGPMKLHTGYGVENATMLATTSEYVLATDDAVMLGRQQSSTAFAPLNGCIVDEFGLKELVWDGEATIFNVEQIQNNMVTMTTATGQYLACGSDGRPQLSSTPYKWKLLKDGNSLYCTLSNGSSDELLSYDNATAEFTTGKSSASLSPLRLYNRRITTPHFTLENGAPAVSESGTMDDGTTIVVEVPREATLQYRFVSDNTDKQSVATTNESDQWITAAGNTLNHVIDTAKGQRIRARSEYLGTTSQPIELKIDKSGQITLLETPIVSEYGSSVAPIYYNLHGQIVANPKGGIYIERIGSNTRKVVIK